MSKITVIGAGSVGSTIANDLMIQGISSEIVLIDVNKQKAFGEAMDIYQGAPFCSPTIVRSGDYDAASGSDIVIITSGLPRKAGQSRLELAQANVNIIKDIAPQITAAAPDAIYIIVSNPVDVLTYVFHKISGVPESHIIGSGTILDTSRLQSTLAKRFCISPKNVHAHVYGEIPPSCPGALCTSRTTILIPIRSIPPTVTASSGTRITRRSSSSSRPPARRSSRTRAQRSMPSRCQSAICANVCRARPERL